MNYILAIDQGTSSTRAIVYNLQAEAVATSQYPLTQYYPKPSWVEHDAEEIWQKTLKAMQDVVAQVPVGSILACGLTNQRETTLIWNKKTSACLAPAIVWQDRRTEAYCRNFVDHAAKIQEKTGLWPDPYFSASKLHWLLEHHPEARQLAAQGALAFGTIDSFLMWRFSNGKAHVTDITNASRTMLFNIHSQQWDADLLKLFAIPESILPQVLPCDSIFTQIHKSHLGFELPITGVAGDQQAALIGQGCLHQGMAKSTYGTGGFLVLNTGDKPVTSQHKLLTTIGYKIKNQLAYALEGSMYHAGTAVKWLRDQLQLIASAEETERLAASLNSNDGVYFVSAFTGLGAPYWYASPGAVLSGLTTTSNKAHVARAVLEGVCYQTRDILACMQADSQVEVGSLRVDGGMTKNRWLLQCLADQCQLIVQKPRDIESTAKGAALLAGLGAGIYSSLEQLATLYDLDETFTTKASTERIEADYQGWCRALALRVPDKK